MKTLIIILLVTIFSITESYAQIRNGIIFGAVKDKKDGQPLSNVNVFISGTKIGTVTDEKGNYKIVGVVQGKHQVVASMVGYEPKVQSIFSRTNENYKLDFNLEPRAYEFNTVDVVGASADEWQENYETFKKYFLGQTELAGECSIENYYLINFKKDGDELKASCPEPIIIINKALGYKIDCILYRFSFDHRADHISILFFPKFTEMTPSNDDEKEDWEENRNISYLSSMRHFLLTIINYGYDNGKYIIAETNDPRNPSLANPISVESILKFNKTEKKYLLSFDGYLFVKNRFNDEKSWLYLPFKNAELDSLGFETFPPSIYTFGEFSKKGIANLVPDDYELSEK